MSAAAVQPLCKQGKAHSTCAAVIDWALACAHLHASILQLMCLSGTPMEAAYSRWDGNPRHRACMPLLSTQIEQPEQTCLQVAISPGRTLPKALGRSLSSHFRGSLAILSVVSTSPACGQASCRILRICTEPGLLMLSQCCKSEDLYAGGKGGRP